MKSKNGIRILLLVIFTTFIYSADLYRLNMDKNGELNKKGNTSKPVTELVTPTPRPVVAPTVMPTATPTPTLAPATPVVRELICDAYVNVPDAVTRSFPEIKKDNIISILHLGNRIHLKEIYVFSDKIWYKTLANTYIYSEYATLDVDVDRSKLMSRGLIDRKGINVNIGEESNLSREQVEYLLRGGGMVGLSDSILYCERLFKVNALLIIAVSKHESANGTSNLARNKNNLFGFNAYGDIDKNAIDYPSKAESVYAFSNLIRNNYFNKGLTVTSSIGEVYCESGDWSELIDEMMRDLLHKLKNFAEDRP